MSSGLNDVFLSSGEHFITLPNEEAIVELFKPILL
jgi:hypothetical protein